MMGDQPEPLVADDVDVRDLDGFMLNVERLMASELVALSSHEVVGACLFLWCRAWKQLPAASLPDDDRVIMAFSRLPGTRYRKVKTEILRGFVKCSDGRLYHRVLAAEATRAFSRKSSYLTRRGKDAERLRLWREKQSLEAPETRHETQSETGDDTQSETRFVAEDTIRYGTVRKEEERESRGGATPPPEPPIDPKPKPRKRRGPKDLVPWPEEFALTAELREIATKQGFDGDWLFEKFRNKALAKGWEYRDWTAAFRNFASTERSYAQPSNATSQNGAWRAPDV